MDEKYKKIVVEKIESTQKDLVKLNKQKKFYDFLENSSYADKIIGVEGHFGSNLRVSGTEYSFVDEFSFEQNSAHKYDFMKDSTAKLVGSLKFFGDSKFSEYGARYNLVDDCLEDEGMDVLYVLNIDETDYSGTPLSPLGPHFTFPKKLNEMEKFYLKKGMKKDLVSRMIDEVGIIRKGLGHEE